MTGGLVAGVVVVIILIVIFIIWRRRSRQSVASTDAPIVAPPDQQYSTTDAIPPTPGSGNPFLTPMAQNQNMGVSYFGNALASPGPSGTNSASQYSGLPEPQYSDNPGRIGMGMDMAAAGGVAMPSPRRDSYQPRPLPMSVVHSNGNNSNNSNAASDAASGRPWSGYASAQPSSGVNANPGAYMHYPEVQSEPSGWSNPVSSINAGYVPYAGGATSSAYGQDRPAGGEAASTVYQPSSHGGHDESLVARSPPPGSPPPDVYAGMASSSAGGTAKYSGLPSGAAPPTMYAPGEKQVYRP